MKTGIELIAEERKRQIEVEGWTPEHDDAHQNEQLANAAGCYALTPTQRYFDYKRNTPYAWPWSVDFWKPSPDRRKDLIKAGALIVAELDRLNRLSGSDV